MTPAIASEPYCADAPSRSTSIRSIAAIGMVLMSVPAEPRPMDCCTLTSACWWRRLPLTSTSTWSGPSPRSVAGQIRSVPSLTKLVGKLNEGASFCSSLPVSIAPVASIASRPITSTGAAVSVSERLPARVPVEITLMVSSLSGSVSPAAFCA